MKNILSICLLALSAIFLITSARAAEDWGSYSGDIETVWLNPSREMRLLSDYIYTGPAPRGMKWIAPKGSIIDGASIPKPFWSVVGGPLDGAYRNASVLHDIACKDKKRPWEDVHLMFYQAMRCSDVPVAKAKMMYWAVYHFGPRWRMPSAIARALGDSGQEIKLRKLGAGSSKWSSKSEQWTHTTPQQPANSREVESPIPPSADAERLSDADLLRFEKWIAKENPSLSELQDKKP